VREKGVGRRTDRTETDEAATEMCISIRLRSKRPIVSISSCPSLSGLPTLPPTSPSLTRTDGI